MMPLLTLAWVNSDIEIESLPARTNAMTEIVLSDIVMPDDSGLTNADTIDTESPMSAWSAEDLTYPACPLMLSEIVSAS